MYISHSVMEAPRCFCLQRPKRDGTSYIIVEVAKALGVSFKLVKTQKNCKGDDSAAQENTKEWGYKQIKKDK